jgi:hypothetical protein
LDLCLVSECPNCGGAHFDEHMEKWGHCLWCFWKPGEEKYGPLFQERKKRKPEPVGQSKLF